MDKDLTFFIVLLERRTDSNSVYESPWSKKVNIIQGIFYII